jgi:hypothetical protein
MKKEQDVLCTVFYDFAILSLVIAMTLLFIIATTTMNVVGAQQPSPPLKTTVPIGSPSISRLNTTGQAASQNAESLVRSMMDPSSLMSTVINETGGSKTNASSTGPQVSTATNRSSINSNNNGSSNTPSASMATTTNMQNTIVTNVDTLLLAHQIIPPKDFIPLYDTSPYKILNGHLDAKIPCDANYAPSLQILVGHLPSLKPVQLQLVKEYSQPGNICMYHVNIGSTITAPPDGGKSLDKAGAGQQSNTTSINTALLLRNPSDYRVVLPNTSAVVIGVNKIMPTTMTENNNSSSQSALPSHQITLTGGNITNHVPESNGQISSILDSMAGLNKQTAK